MQACSVTCFAAARAVYLALKDNVAICAPEFEAMLIQAKMWQDEEEAKDEDQVIFDENEFALWSWPELGTSKNE
jgi:hypothetical protein